MQSPYNYFSVHELVCHGLECGCDHALHMNDLFMQKLVKVREQCGFAFVLSSAYRCPAHNAEASHTGLSGPHTTGRAVDVLCYGKKAFRVIEEATRFGMTGIGINQKGPRQSRFIHLDDLGTDNRPWIWSY